MKSVNAYLISEEIKLILASQVPISAENHQPFLLSREDV